jgi:hypothetical protein
MDMRNNKDYYVNLANKLHQGGMSFTDAWDRAYEVYGRDKNPVGLGTGLTKKTTDRSTWSRGILHIPSDEGGLGLTWKPYEQYGNRGWDYKPKKSGLGL